LTCGKYHLIFVASLTTKLKAMEFHIQTLEWFDKVNGNSYNAVVVYLDNSVVAQLPYEYGYGNFGEQRVKEQLARRYGFTGSIREFAEKKGATYSYYKKEGCKQRELKAIGDFWDWDAIDKVFARPDYARFPREVVSNVKISHKKTQMLGGYIMRDEQGAAILDVRFYPVGKNNVACCFWLKYENIECSGSAKTQGYGYHKQSEALGMAIESAGIKIRDDIRGAGESAMSQALGQMVQQLGLKPDRLYRFYA
jgi:hypothetical protein